MARIRSIKPEFFTSITMADCTPEQRLTFIGLWTYVDDNGVGIDDARLVRAAVWPLDDRTREDVEADLEALQKAGVIQRYEAGGRRYVAVTNFVEHQKVSHPRKPRYPTPDEATNPDGTPPDQPQHASSGASPEDARKAPEILRPEQGSGSRDQGAGSREGGARERARAAARATAPPRAEARAPIDDANFRVTDGMRRWAGQTFPRVDLEYETAQFLDHFRGEGTRRHNWPNEWQRWIRRANQWAVERAQRLPAVGGNVIAMPGTTDARVAGWLELADRLEAQQAGGAP